MNPFGPVMLYDLSRTARRGRGFALRFLLGLMLLLLMIIMYRDTVGQHYNPTRLPRFAEEFFIAYLFVQFLVILLLAPAYVGGAIAEEKERGTFAVLLTTQMNDLEIILSKLFARLGYFMLLLLTGLPVIALLQVLGGIQPAQLWMGFSLTLTSLLMVGSIGMYHSATAPTTREAVIRTLMSTMLVAVVGDFVCVAIWFAVGRQWFFWVIGWTSGFFELLLAVWFLRLAMTRLRTGANSRPTTPPAGTASTSAGKTLAKRPPVGDAPMMWFEIHLRQKIWRLLDWVVILVLGLPILIPSYLCYQGTIGPDGLNTAIRFIGAFLTAGAALAAANNAASALWLEREKGILDTLLVTPLEPNEILIAKWRGALLNPLGVYGWLAALWLAGSLTGGLHPTALLMLPLLLAAYVTLAASFGLAMSLRSASRAQAQLWTGLTIVSAGWGPIVGQLAVAQFGEYDWGNSPMKILTLFYLPLFVAGSYALYDDALLTFRRKYYRMAP